MVSLAPVSGDSTSLISRFSQMTIANSIDFDQIVSLHKEILGELKFWLERVDGLNSRDCKPGISPVAISIMGDVV